MDKNQIDEFIYICLAYFDNSIEISLPIPEDAPVIKQFKVFITKDPNFEFYQYFLAIALEDQSHYLLFLENIQNIKIEVMILMKNYYL